VSAYSNKPVKPLKALHPSVFLSSKQALQPSVVVLTESPHMALQILILCALHFAMVLVWVRLLLLCLQHLQLMELVLHLQLLRPV
jgi:hypothetical protein